MSTNIDGIDGGCVSTGDNLNVNTGFCASISMSMNEVLSRGRILSAGEGVNAKTRAATTIGFLADTNRSIKENVIASVIASVGAVGRIFQRVALSASAIAG